MNKIQSLREHLKAAVPFLQENPDKLLMFAETGSVSNRARLPSLSFSSAYTATIIITDYAGTPDAVFVPIIAWLKKHYPHRADEKAFDFQAEILDNDSVDLEIKVPLDEFVNVTDNGDDTVSTTHLGEILPASGFNEANPLSEWELHHGG